MLLIYGNIPSPVTIPIEGTGVTNTGE